MKTRYPVVLVHGIMLKDVKFFKAFGRIEKTLKSLGYCVYTANTDGFGTIENNAAQLKEFIYKVLEKEGCKKVNIIAHSKGGLDAKYMILNLNTAESVASLTTLCTPHKGSPIASFLFRLPKFIKKIVAFFVNLCYRVFGDKRPDSLRVCEQLQSNPPEEATALPQGIYCQSFSTTLKRSRDDFIMGIPLAFCRYMDKDLSDGLVPAESAKFANYRGECIDGSVSHSQIVDFMAGKKKREKIYAFYGKLLEELAQMGL
ncbi:MAG: hypothetical protein K2N30_02790 [Clostridia bacterium]|nr:hypothetical protein [Clostridia bacterium]